MRKLPEREVPDGRKAKHQNERNCQRQQEGVGATDCDLRKAGEGAVFPILGCVVFAIGPAVVTAMFHVRPRGGHCQLATRPLGAKNDSYPGIACRCQHEPSRDQCLEAERERK